MAQAARSWRAGGALALFLLSTSIMNGTVFPLFDAVFMFARDISVTVAAIAYVALGLAAWRAPHLLTGRLVVAGNALAVAIGVAATAGGVALASAPLLVAGSSLAAAGRSGIMVSVGLALTRLEARSAALAIGGAFAFQLIVSPLTGAMGATVGLALFAALPLAALALVAPPAVSSFEFARGHASPSDLSITRPASFVALFSLLFACLFFFQLAFGFALRFEEVAGSPRASIVPAVPVVLVTGYMALTRRPFPADFSVQLSALAIIAGFLCAVRPLLFAPAADVALLNAGHGLFNLTAQIALVAVAARNPVGAVTVLAWGSGVQSLGSLAGAGAGMIGNAAAAADATWGSLIPAVLLLVFAGWVIIGLKRFSFAELIAGVEPVEVSPAAAPEDLFDDRCAQVAERFALTPREAEVFAMLARGRDRAYIEEALVVSRNTVKAHVKHVYAKLGIHSHQELIDLVEG
ncbi:helix-turn-helix transcriptional regulator [uncultured Adlercreutzia sp.]|uniref:helix-turn-helix transcriptional regulator n=1 Tax=uncultured Adlercreutzia sp. TaxID=875803 RepID=UPI0025E072C5|nr:helix-turn-helix transcriptional regulator [uncultured Adlercreutzia sp.]